MKSMTGRRRSAAVAALVALTACTGEPTLDYGGVFDGSAGRWIDLTHAFGPNTIYWPTDTAGFELQELAFGPTEGGWFYASYAFSSAEHGGTHLDAPIHFAEGRLATDEIPLSGLMGPAAVVDVSAQATPDYLVTVEDLTDWEGEHGPIPDGGVLLIRTGWGARARPSSCWRRAATYPPWPWPSESPRPSDPRSTRSFEWSRAGPAWCGHP